MTELPKRKTIRLANYDYSTCGAYFVTICTHNKCNTLSSIRRGDPCGRPQVQLTPLGQIVEKAFPLIAQRYNVTIDSYIIMPNHIHFIVAIPPSSTIALGYIVGAFKSTISTQWLHVCKERNQVMGRIWQRNYYEHIIRNDLDLQETQYYIESNPDRWQEDKYHTL